MLHRQNSQYLEVSTGVKIHYKTIGDGPPLLLLHGYPTTHRIWSNTAELLKDNFTIVAPDLRGYGESEVTNVTGVEQFSKRSMANDLIELMAAIGYTSFFLAGHDRGGRVAYRLTLDHPSAVKKLIVMDIIPTAELIRSFDWNSSLGAFHWSFCSAPEGWPEAMIGADPDDFLIRTLQSWSHIGHKWDKDEIDAYKQSFRKSSVIAATCQDFRAVGKIDLEHDLADLEKSHKISSPTLVIWGSESLGKAGLSPSVVWENWSQNAIGREIISGHFLPAENPVDCAKAIIEFLL